VDCLFAGGRASGALARVRRGCGSWRNQGLQFVEEYVPAIDRYVDPIQFSEFF
jgi:hypothetical protein